MTGKDRIATVDASMATVPANVRERLETIRTAIHAAVPGTSFGIVSSAAGRTMRARESGVDTSAAASLLPVKPRSIPHSAIAAQV